MSYCNWSRRAALTVTLLALGVLAACGGENETRTARAELTVMLPQALASTDVVRVHVEVSGPGISLPMSAELSQSGGSWQGTIANIPAGVERTFVATAFDSTAKPLYKGQAGPVSIEPGRTASVAILLQQLEVPPPFENEAPRIDSVVVSSNPVEPGGTVMLTATARDANTGDTLRYLWSATAGTFSAPTSAVTSWTAPSSEGSQRIQLEVVDSKGASATLSINIGVVSPGSVGGAVVTAGFNTWPTITSMNGVPSVLVLGGVARLSASVTDVDGDALLFSWGSDCVGRFDDATLASPTFILGALPATGRCAFRLQVSDGRGGRHLGSLILHAGTGAPSGSAPQIDGTWQTHLEAPGGELVTMGVFAHDPEGTPLRYSWTASVGDFMWGPRDSATYTERYLRLPGCFSGPVLVTASIQDATGNTVSQLFSIAARPGSECAPTMVTGEYGALNVQPDGSIIPSPYILSFSDVGAWVPEGSGYVWRAGTGHDHGTFVIPDVPEGSPYLLRLENRYIWTDKRVLDLNRALLGRPQEVLEPEGTQLELQLEGLSPWQAQDDLQFHSATAGLGYISTSGCGLTDFPLPAEGGTGSSGSIDYAAFTGGCANQPFRLDSTQDTLYVTQLASRTDTVTGIEYQETRRSLRFSGPARTSTGSILLQGTMEALPTSTQTLDIRGSEFESLALAAHPTATLTSKHVGIDPLLGYSEFGAYAGSPDLAVAFVRTPGGGDFTPVFEFSNPYPRDWPLFVYTQASASVRYSIELPDGSTSSSRAFSSYVLAMEPWEVAATRPIHPKVGPARELRLNGLDATGKLTGVGTTPLVSWTPPTLGVPTHYQLRLYRLYTAPGSSFLSRQLVTYLYTPQTQLRLPPELLLPGENYYLQVSSYYRPGTDPSNPYRSSVTNHVAQAFTGVFKP